MIIINSKHIIFKNITNSIYLFLREHNIETQLSNNIDYSNKNLYIFIGINKLIKKYPENYIIYQFEQANSYFLNYDGEKEYNYIFNENYIQILKNAIQVWDYSIQNKEWLSDNIKIKNILHVPVCFDSNITNYKSNTIEKDIDILFYGSLNKKRKNILNKLQKLNTNLIIVIKNNDCWEEDLLNIILRSKIILNIHYYENAILEMHRLSYLFNTKSFIISENVSDKNQMEIFKNSLIFCNYDDIIDTCIYWLSKDHKKEKDCISYHGYVFFKIHYKYELYLNNFIEDYKININNYQNTTTNNSITPNTYKNIESNNNIDLEKEQNTENKIIDNIDNIDSNYILVDYICEEQNDKEQNDKEQNDKEQNDKEQNDKEQNDKKKNNKKKNNKKKNNKIEWYIPSSIKNAETLLKDDGFFMLKLPDIEDENLPYISIITPTKNRRKLFSIPIQNYNNFIYPKHKIEWVIVDDGKEDLKDLFINLKNINYIQIKNNDKLISIGEKRNLCVQYSKYEYIICMDDDDYYPPESIYARIKTLLKHPEIGCVGCNSIGIYDFISNKSFLASDGNQYFSEASMGFTKTFWKERSFYDYDIKGEGKYFLQYREKKLIHIPFQFIIIALQHNTNFSNKIRNTNNIKSPPQPSTISLTDNMQRSDDLSTLFPIEIIFFLQTLKKLIL
jgi:hypothetical protein